MSLSHHFQPIQVMLLFLLDFVSENYKTFENLFLIVLLHDLFCLLIVPDLQCFSEFIFHFPSTSGNAVTKIKSNDGIKVMTVRATSFDPAAEGASGVASENGEEMLQ